MQQKNAFVVQKQWRQKYVIKQIEFSKSSINENELLRWNFAIYILNDSVTRKEILKTHHDDLFSNYFARARTENTIRRKYFWSNILFEIKQYVCTYSDYQRVRVHHHKLYNELDFILSNEEDSFHIMIMNFIIDILSTRNLYINKITMQFRFW